MGAWLYLMTAHRRFPEPLAEIAALVALFEQDDTGEVCLLLADRSHPPMSGARPGDSVLLCTRDSDGLLQKHAVATVGATPIFHSEPPAILRHLYPEATNRFFLPLSNLSGIPAQTVSELSHEEQITMASGQAYVRRLDKSIEPPTASKLMSSVVRASPGVALAPRPRVSTAVVVGLDPTAGIWPGMTHGPKSMPSVGLHISAEGTVQVHEAGVRWHKTNEEFWQHVQEVGATVTCIDGPCATAGPRVLPDWTGWDEQAPDGVRTCERELTRLGMSLFWTTQATVTGFPGASRWIARSLRLFQEARDLNVGTVIETHPHGVFTALWRQGPHATPLPRKTKPDGRACRLQLLRHSIAGLNDDVLKNHDAVDATAAALLAALYFLGRAVGYGTARDGGTIWLPATV